MKCDREQRPGANLRRSHANVFLTSLGQHVPLKINVGFAKVWRNNNFLAKNVEQPSYIYICIYMCIYIYICIYIHIQKTIQDWNVKLDYAQ